MKLLALCLLPLFLAATACEKPDRTVRHYREVSFVRDDAAAEAAPMPSEPSVPGAGRMADLPPELQTPLLPLAWDTPEGWDNLGGSGMRIATLKIQGQECTILSFPGDVGGDEANIRRWLGQLGHTVSDDVMTSFVSAPTVLSGSAGYEVRMFDFDDILPADAAISTLAGIIPIGTSTAFVKFTGERSVLAGEKSNFEALCRSVRLIAEKN
jgi:hypothetical protein